MNDFLQNIIRYPRFFISSVIVLIFIILTPLRNLYRIETLRIFLIIILITVIGFLVTIIRMMVGL